ncbi:MAG: hypothetical protein LBM96_05945 [Methanobrevibacter sp.]|jgi:dUTP pyrophosphatase|nr:hypothetical protein [Candidatus Methanoflexus mossambicus]
MKIPIKIYRRNIDVDYPEILNKGDWIDISTISNKTIYKNKQIDFDFGIVIKVPKGYEINILPRSSTFKKYGLLLTNSMGIIDNSYCGPEDFIGGIFYATKDEYIQAYTRLIQFKVVLSQKATIWQKLKHIFLYNGIKIVKISKKELNKNNRGGYGSTGN